MKKVVTTITAAIFALGLVSAGLAQTTQTPEKPAVKTETSAPAVAKPEVAKPEVAKPGEKPAAKEAVKPGEAKKEVKGAKKETKKEVKQGKDDKKPSAPVEKTQPEKK
jgi:hypothetical protein